MADSALRVSACSPGPGYSGTGYPLTGLSFLYRYGPIYGVLSNTTACLGVDF